MKHKKLKTGIIKNSIWSFLSTIINRAGTLVFTIILARLLLPENYGIYSLTFSIAMIFYSFGDLGINQALIRYITYTLHKKDKGLAAHYHYLLRIKFYLVSIVSLLLLFLAYPIANYMFHNNALFLPLLVSAFYIFILSFETFYTGLFYSLERIGFLTFKETLSQILRIVAITLVLLFVVKSYEIVGIFMFLTLVSLVLFLYVFIYVRKLCPQMFLKSDVEIDKKRIMRFVGYLTIASISTLFFLYLDSIILGMFLKPEYVGYYRAAFSLIMGINGLVTSFGPILLPLFTHLHKDKIEKVFQRVIKYYSILVIPACFGILILGSYFLRLFYGYAYLPATLPLYFLSLLLFPMAMVGIFLSLFSAEEKPQILAKLIIFTSLINIILNIIFIKLFMAISSEWATAGAAIALLISWIYYLFASRYYVTKQFGINVSFMPAIKPLIAGIVMAAVVLIIKHYFVDINLFSGMVLVVAGAISYFTLMILIGGINKGDFDLISLIIKGKQNK